MKVLVTGCNGQVGYYLTRKLEQSADVELLALDKTHLDITDKAAVMKRVKQFNPDYIINAAAHTAVDKAETEIELSYQINRDGAQNLAEAAQLVGAAIFHISTDYVFPGNKDGIYSELDATAPQGVYGESKLAGEIAVSTKCEKHIILRTAWVFSQQGNNFVKTMLKLGKDRPELGIIGDQFGGPTYAGDIANALISMVNQSELSNEFNAGIYHYSGYPHVNWFEFANTIFDEAVKANVLVKKPILNKINTDQYPTPAKRPENSRLNCTKIFDSFAIEQSDWMCALKNIKEYV